MAIGGWSSWPRRPSGSASIAADIRAVFCVSPPTDLAALYQQLGRAGRDRAAHPGEPGPFTAALAISYPRAQRTI